MPQGDLVRPSIVRLNSLPADRIPSGLDANSMSIRVSFSHRDSSPLRRAPNPGFVHRETDPPCELTSEIRCRRCERRGVPRGRLPRGPGK